AAWRGFSFFVLKKREMHDAFAACGFNLGFAFQFAQKLAAVWASCVTQHRLFPPLLRSVAQAGQLQQLVAAFTAIYLPRACFVH
ncbi:MAG: hypothetical protein IKV55_01870, partial [Oscillospiraceae bacterium]|nr:hypothetical protein [Oscillospiraceae bacterium]